MVDSDMFSALRVRQRLEDIARTITEARISGDIYVSLDAVEHALLAVIDEVNEIARAVADTQARERSGRSMSWARRFTTFRSSDRA